MSRFSGRLWLILISLSLAALTGCSGGISGTGKQSSGVSVGQVEGFGSIFVNGVEFDTSNATLIVENTVIGIGDAVVNSNLAQGQVVRVTGSFNADGTTGVADTIEYESLLTGVIDSITANVAGSRQLVAMGYTVLVDDQTLFDGTDITSLMAGQVIEVSGFFDATSIHASYIKSEFTTTYEVKGTIKTIVDGAKFELVNNALTIIFNTSGLQAGTFIAAQGADTNLSGSSFIADSVEERQGDIGASEGDEVELEGYVTSIIIFPYQFYVDGQLVQASASTEYHGGIATDIAVGLKLEVEGEYVGGVLVADEVEFGEEIELEAVATVTGSTLTFSGLPGITATINDTTELDGNNVPDFNGALIMVRGHMDKNGGSQDLIATRIEIVDSAPLDDGNYQAELQGPVEGTTLDPDIVILGITVDTSLWSDSQFVDSNDIEIGRSLFFASAINNALVKVKGDFVISGGIPDAIVWAEAELE